MSVYYVRRKPTETDPEGDILFLSGALQAPAGSLGYDQELDATSQNAVENQVVTFEINTIKAKNAEQDERLDNLETVDNSPTRFSEHLVLSGGVYDAIQDAIAENRVERVLALPTGLNIENKVYEYNGDIYVGSQQQLIRIASYAELEAARPVQWSLPAVAQDKIYATDEVYIDGVKVTPVRVYIGKENEKFVELATKEGLDEKQALAEKGQPNGYAPLDQNGKLPTSYLPTSAIVYMGTWDATTDYPTVGSGTGGALVRGDYYIVSVAGVKDEVEYEVGDWAMYNGETWDKLDQSSDVKSVNTKKGDVVLDADDLKTTNSSSDIYADEDTIQQALDKTEAYVLNTVKTVNSVGVTSGTRNVAITTANLPNTSALAYLGTAANATQDQINTAINAELHPATWSVGSNWKLSYTED